MNLIILDRDGVINYDSNKFIKDPSEWKPYKQSLDAIRKLKLNNWTVCIATNQSGIGRNLFSEKTLFKIHSKMINQLKKINTSVDYIIHCPHKPQDNCSCRKPKPGMYLTISNKYNFDLKKAIVVGDSLRDLLAADKVGAKPILVLTGKGKETLKSGNLPNNTEVYKDLSEYVDFLMS